MKQPAVYIVTNKRNGTLYTGATSDLVKRISHHREGIMPGFNSRNDCKLLVWYEPFEDMPNAIARRSRSKRDRGRGN